MQWDVEADCHGVEEMNVADKLQGVNGRSFPYTRTRRTDTPAFSYVAIAVYVNFKAEIYGE